MADMVTVTKSTRLFEQFDTRTLSRTGQHVSKGDKIVLGTKSRMTYDHRDQDAFPCVVGGKSYWVLADEFSCS